MEINDTTKHDGDYDDEVKPDQRRHSLSHSGSKNLTTLTPYVLKMEALYNITHYYALNRMIRK